MGSVTSAGSFRALILVATMALGACTQSAPDNQLVLGGQQQDKRITVTAREERLTLSAHTDGTLSQDARAQVSRFMQAREMRRVDVVLQAQTAAGEAAIDRLSRRLHRAGAHKVRVLEGEGTARGDVVLSARWYVAEPPPCPDWRRPEALNPANRRPSNFGCANAVNRANTVDDPRDLRWGAPLGPVPAAEAVDALEPESGGPDGG